MKSTKLIDITFKDSAERMGIGEDGERQVVKPSYHYGLRLCLNNEMMSLLGIKDVPKVGEKAKMKAVVEVCCVSMSESEEYGSNKTMDLQITEMELDFGGKDHAKALYNKNIIESED